MLSLTVVAAADLEPIAAEKAKQGVERAVPFLVDSSDKGFKKHISGQECLSCHWAGAAILGLNGAHRRGFVDRKDVDKFDSLLKKQSTRMLVYQLSDKALNELKTAGAAEAQLAALKKKVGHPFATPDELAGELAKELAPELLEQHQADILKRAVNPDYYAVAGHLMASTSLLAGAAASSSAPEEITRGLIERLLKAQAADGSFPDGGQPMFPQAAPEERLQCATSWCLLALGSVDTPSEAVSRSMTRGQEFLKKSKPAKSTMTLALRTLLAQRMKETDSAAALASELLKLQQADGGWSSWSWAKAERGSDALATGAALYALGSQVKFTDASIQRAWAFLLKTQEEDGGWTTTNSQGKARQIYTYWATSWAVLGLLETLPR